jgi:hypothetical protein
VATVVKKSGNEIQDTGARISINFTDRRAKNCYGSKKNCKKKRSFQASLFL